jgi:hypothetical protein
LTIGWAWAILERKYATLRWGAGSILMLGSLQKYRFGTVLLFVLIHAGALAVFFVPFSSGLLLWAATYAIPMRWTTEIRRWEPPFRFTDAQVASPFRLWRHTYRFETRGGGTRMTDVVRYRLPLGIVGRAVHSLKVRRDVERIFDHRFQRITELLAGRGPAEASGQA